MELTNILHKGVTSQEHPYDTIVLANVIIGFLSYVEKWQQILGVVATLSTNIRHPCNNK